MGNRRASRAWKGEDGTLPLAGTRSPLRVLVFWEGYGLEGVPARSDMAQQVQALAREGKVACATLLELAARLGVSPLVLGRLADELGLRIAGCQLGCFR